jgi:hypothetical protein
MRVRDGRRDQLELLGEKVAERANVRKVDEKHLLDGGTGRADNVERIVVVSHCLVVGKDQDDLTPIDKDITHAHHGIIPPNHANLFTAGRHATSKMPCAIQLLGKTITAAQIVECLRSARTSESEPVVGIEGMSLKNTKVMAEWICGMMDRQIRGVVVGTTVHQLARMDP